MPCQISLSVVCIAGDGTSISPHLEDDKVVKIKKIYRLVSMAGDIGNGGVFQLMPSS